MLPSPGAIQGVRQGVAALRSCRARSAEHLHTRDALPCSPDWARILVDRQALEHTHGLEPFVVAIEEIAEFDLNCWFTESEPPTCRAVAEHARRIASALETQSEHRHSVAAKIVECRTAASHRHHQRLGWTDHLGPAAT